MARFKKVPQAHEGKVVYYDGIISGIVLLAVKEIPFIELDTKETSSLSRNNAIKVRRDRDEIHIDVTVKIHFTQNVSDMSFKIQEAIRHNVEAMTEYHVASVNVHISAVSFEDKVEVLKAPTTETTEPTETSDVAENIEAKEPTETTENK